MEAVSNGIFRGPHPKDERTFKMMKTILNLQTGFWEILFGNPNEEFNSCVDNEVTLHDMAWHGIFPPRVEDVISALTVMKIANKPLYVHCRHGRERTGFMVAVYRMAVENWEFDRAYAEWKAMGCRWPVYLLWKKRLRHFERLRNVPAL